ncbi:metallophosphoesterase [Chitinophaga sp. S165]|uniref:metallophosphoesterase n=1 Tax=Chitinophaga sp. S165 TaxID=2135462 RepID=UPI000D70D896|nr:metallophosphoesterase [Chitinophaga sp. S165]PWV51931.1 thiol-disulfide isomerase/thioredoxin [Chitinophaga sp. S165]
MIKSISSIGVLFIICIGITVDAKHIKEKKTSVYIHMDCDASFNLDSVKIGVEDAKYVLAPKFNYIKLPLQQNRPADLKLECDSGLLIDFSHLLGKDFAFIFLEQGDSLNLKYRNGKFQFSGIGVQKLDLINEWSIAKQMLKKPKNQQRHKVKSVSDFWDWHYYLSQQQSLLIKILRKYKNSLSPLAQNYIEANELAHLEYRKLIRFEIFVNGASKYGITSDSLDSIFDHEFNTPTTALLTAYSGWIRDHVYYYSYIRMLVLKSHRYNWEDPFMKSANRKVRYVQTAKLRFQGHPLHAMLTLLLTNSGLKEHTIKDGYTPQIDSLLKDFYLLPGFPEYKKFVKAYENKISGWVSGKGYNTYDFSLPDENGTVFKRSNLEGKIVLVNFWDRNPSSLEMNEVLRKIQKNYRNDTNLAFINITSLENKTPHKKKRNPRYNQTTQKFLYFKNDDEVAPVLKAFNVTTYPSLYLLDENGKSLYNQTDFSSVQASKENDFPDPRKDNGKALSKNIGEQLVLLNDGPYIFRDKDSLQLHYMRSQQKITKKVNHTRPFEFTVNSDQYLNEFHVSLIDSVVPSSGVYDQQEKTLVLSDIEGNFKAFKKLLISSKVIDENFEWIFGSGHLVFNGDMFDRGKQVTECLWLIYSLEQKAKAAGGAVHFILGNHEVMNLLGDSRYMDNKYKRYLEVSGYSEGEYMSNNSELGHWLRSKNVIEKIGSVLYVHGGISPQLNKLNLSIDSINIIARLCLNSSPLAKSLSDSLTVLLNSEYSPFWFRGYYTQEKNETITQTIDETRNKFGVSTIVTGHTIMADTINVHFGGKVINVDTYHAKGKSEALLIENDRFFRISSTGQKKELFDSDQPVAIKE